MFQTVCGPGRPRHQARSPSPPPVQWAGRQDDVHHRGAVPPHPGGADRGPAIAGGANDFNAHKFILIWESVSANAIYSIYGVIWHTASQLSRSDNSRALYVYIHDLLTKSETLLTWWRMTLDSMWCVYFKSFPNFVQVLPHDLALALQVPGGGAQGLVAAGHRLVPGGLLLQGEYHKKCTMVTGRCWLGRTTVSIPKVPLNNLL